MIRVTTEHGTQYIIDEDNKQIKRIPIPGNELNSFLNGFINIGEFQPYTEFTGLKLEGRLQVQYPNEQQWSYSTLIAAIDYDYEEEFDD